MCALRNCKEIFVIPKSETRYAIKYTLLFGAVTIERMDQKAEIRFRLKWKFMVNEHSQAPVTLNK